MILGVTFPLTLTLSLGEREQPLDAFFKFKGRPAESSRGLARKREMIPPLPKGEGRGEGKVSIHLTSILIFRHGLADGLEQFL